MSALGRKRTFCFRVWASALLSRCPKRRIVDPRGKLFVGGVMRLESTAAVLLAFWCSSALVQSSAPPQCPNEPPPLVCPPHLSGCVVLENWSYRQRTTAMISTHFHTG